jgi:hypothetical protein
MKNCRLGIIFSRHTMSRGSRDGIDGCSRHSSCSGGFRRDSVFMAAASVGVSATFSGGWTGKHDVGSIRYRSGGCHRTKGLSSSHVGAPAELDAISHNALAVAGTLLRRAPRMFLSAKDLEQLTGLKRPGAQARWLSTRGYKFERRVDGTIALRLDELDAHTLSKSSARKQRRALDLSYLDKAS